MKKCICILSLLFMATASYGVSVPDTFVDLDGGQVQSVNKTTVLHAAVKIDDFGMVESLIDAGVDVNARDENGDTPLVLALRIYRTSHDNSDTVALLLKNGAEFGEGYYSPNILESAYIFFRLYLIQKHSFLVFLPYEAKRTLYRGEEIKRAEKEERQ